MIKQWNIHSGYDKDQAEYLQVNCGVNRIVSALLVQRGITTTDEVQAFFNPELSMLHDPFLMKGMDLAVERISEAITKNERILVYGDYDVDGTTAVALLYSFLLQQTSNIGYYIPDRYKEGYGISTTGINYAEQTGCTLIIALDCDALDPSIVPGVIGRAPGGLTYWQVVELIHGIAGKATIAAFDVVEYMPDVDVDAIGALNNARIICNVLGLVSRQANW